jgi:excisionase family DNA binding protein
MRGSRWAGPWEAEILTKLLSVKELAILLGVHRVTIYDWVSQRMIPFVKVGARTMFDPREIERWLRERSFPEGGGRREWAIRRGGKR